MSNGMRAKNVADMLGINRLTVQSHIRNIYRKMGALNMPHVLYKLLTNQDTAAQAYCAANQCEIIRWISPDKAADIGNCERCILQYENNRIEAMHIGGGVFVSNGNVMPKPLRVTRYPKGIGENGYALPA